MSSVVVWNDDIANVEIAWHKHVSGVASGFAVTWYQEGMSPETSYPVAKNVYGNERDALRFGRRKALNLHVARASRLLACASVVTDPVGGIEAITTGRSWSLRSPGSQPFADGLSHNEAAMVIGMAAYAAMNARNALEEMAKQGEVPTDASSLDSLSEEAVGRLKTAASMERRKAMRLVSKDFSDVPVMAVGRWLEDQPLQRFAPSQGPRFG